MLRFDIPIKPLQVAGETLTHFQVSIYKDSSREKVVASIHPAATNDKTGLTTLIMTGNGCVWFYVEDMKRLNQKRLNKILDEAQQEIHNKTGRFYENVLKAAKEINAELQNDHGTGL